MGKITDPANPNYDFGLDFDYSVWPKGTQIDLVNVPWNNDYRDVVKFLNKDELTKYINNLQPAGVTIHNLSYVKPNQPIKLNIPYNRAIRYNYLRASNPLQPIPDDVIKDYYYFILDVRYIAPQTTELIIQLDVWQTYVYDVVLGNSYVERGHIGIANEVQFEKFGRDYLTVPEGLDIGGEYMSAKGIPWVWPNQDVLVCSTIDLEKPPVNGSGQAIVNSASGSTFKDNSGRDTVTTGTTYYLFSASAFKSFLNTYADKPWVTQGIIAAYNVPDFTQWANGGLQSTSIGAWRLDGLQFQPSLIKMWANWRNSAALHELIPDRYWNLKKFFTSPYMFVQITTMMGKPIVLKPESWWADDADVVTRASFGNPNQRIEFAPNNYNHVGEITSDANGPMPLYNGGDYFDVATSISDFPSVPIVNNSAIAYLTSNKNSIAFQYQSAAWDQQRALGSNQAQFDITSGAISTASQLTDIGVNADIAQTANANRTRAAQSAVSSIGGVAGGGVGGVAFGGTGAGIGAANGAVSGIANNVNTMIGNAAENEARNIRILQARGSVDTSNRQTQLMRDTNKSLSDWAARGDYANQIAGINAKVRDAQVIQPTVSGQIGGEFINTLNGTGSMALMTIKTLQENAMKIVGEYWLRFGYAIHEFINIPESMMVMSKFTYWKLIQTYIKSSNVPEGMKQSIRGIFEKGVTVWANPDDIGVIDMADNLPIAGVRY